MASHRRSRPAGPTALSRAAATVVAAGAAVLAAQQSAAAAPGPSGAGTVRQQVDSLYAQAEAAGQQYDGAQEQQRELQRRSAELQQRVAAEQEQINQLTQAVGAVAAAQYASGDMDPVLRLAFSAHPEDYLRQAAMLDQAGGAVAQDLRQLEEAQHRLDADRAAAEAQLRQLERLRQRIAGSKAEIQRRLGRAQALLGSLTAPQRAQIQQQEEEQAAAAQSLAQQALSGLLDVPASARAGLALRAAESRLGSPYVYGATGPHAFDCSGLMYWSWQQAGVTLPRTAAGQASAGRRVPLSQARPGDLVIFYGDMHHVGMYAGNGMVIHAPIRAPGSATSRSATCR
ncbi:NlpC/P60 family protein [Streptacidiphilus monticola]